MSVPSLVCCGTGFYSEKNLDLQCEDAEDVLASLPVSFSKKIISILIFHR